MNDVYERPAQYAPGESSYLDAWKYVERPTTGFS